jgi:hypothetical protein
MIPLALLVMSMSAVGLMIVGAHSSYWPIFATLAASSGGIGLLAAGTTSMVMSALPPEDSGMASGTQSATRQLGGALGVAIIGSLLAAKYAASLAHSLAGTAAAPVTAAAQRSLAAALALPHTSSSVQELVARLARVAFVDGTHLVGVVVGVLGIASAVVVYVALSRQLSPRAEQAASALVLAEQAVSPLTTASLVVADNEPR